MNEEDGYGYFYGEGNDLVADVIDGGDSLLFLPSPNFYDDEKVVDFIEEENEATSHVSFLEEEEVVVVVEGFEEEFYQEDQEGTEEGFYQEDDGGTEEDSQQLQELQSSELYDSQSQSQGSGCEYVEEYSIQDEEEVQTNYLNTDFVHIQNLDEESVNEIIGSVDEWTDDFGSQIDEQEILNGNSAAKFLNAFSSRVDFLVHRFNCACRN